MKEVTARAIWYSGTNVNQYEYLQPLQLFVEQKDIEVASAKPSEIQVGDNIDEVLTNLENKINTIRSNLLTWDYDYFVSFKSTGNSGVVSTQTDFDFLFAGTMKDIQVNTDPSKISILRINGCGCTFNSGSSGRQCLIINYKNISNNSSVDASFRQIKYVVYDKYTKTIKSVSDSKQVTADDEAQVVINVIVQAPSLSSITSEVKTPSLSPDYVEITDPEIGKLCCYVANDKPFYKPNTNSSAMVGLSINGDGRDARFYYINNGSEPYVHLSYHDISTVIKPEVYSRV